MHKLGVQQVKLYSIISKLDMQFLSDYGVVAKKRGTDFRIFLVLFSGWMDGQYCILVFLRITWKIR